MALKKVNIFWTGGWDSTFRILLLSNKEVDIQPYYLKDNRQSEELEINTVRTLTKKILKLETTKCKINELIILSVSDIENDQSITSAYNNIRKEFISKKGRRLGTQYEWLARFSKNIKNLELGIEKGSKVIDVINMYGEFEKKTCKLKGEYFILNKENSSKDLIVIFGNYHFPLLTYTKLEMKQISENKGFIDLMNETWFCYTPENDKPCGKCNPCTQTIDFGLKYRFGHKALLAYRLRKIEKIVKGKIKYIFN